MNRAKVAALFFSMALTTVAAPAMADIVVKGKDAPVQIKVPRGWSIQDVPANGDASIQLMAVKEKDLLGALVVYEKTDVKLSVDEYGKKVLDHVTAGLTDASHTDWKPVKEDGHDALRCELKGTCDKLELKYLLTVIKTDDSYDQVVAWSLAENFDKSKAELEKVSDSFKQAANVAGPKTLTGKNGTTELTVPDGWTAVKKLPNKDIQLMAMTPRASSS